VTISDFDFYLNNDHNLLSLHFQRVYVMASGVEYDAGGSEIDPIWTTSRTARQIYALGEVDKVVKTLSFVSFGTEVFILSART